GGRGGGRRKCMVAATVRLGYNTPPPRLKANRKTTADGQDPGQRQEVPGQQGQGGDQVRRQPHCGEGRGQVRDRQDGEREEGRIGLEGKRFEEGCNGKEGNCG